MLQRLSFLFIVVMLTACNTAKLTLSSSELSALKAEAQQSKKSTTDLLTEYDSKLDTLGLDSLSFYSPLNMASSKDNVASAKKLIATSQKANEAQAKYHLISALKNLDRAFRNKMAVKLHLKKADTHFTELKKLNSQQLMPDKFTQAKSEFTNLITLIELGDTQKAIALEENLIEIMLELEVNTLIKIHLNEAYTYIEKSLSLNADDYAPNSLHEAKQAAHETKKFIKEAFRDRYGISEKSTKTKYLAKKLFYIAQEAHKVHSNSNEEIEKKILNDFAFIDNIKSTIKVSNSTIESYPVQQERTLSLLKSKQVEQAKNLELEECKQQKEVLVGKIKQLEQEALYHNRTIISEETNKAVLPELFLH